MCDYYKNFKKNCKQYVKNFKYAMDRREGGGAEDIDTYLFIGHGWNVGGVFDGGNKQYDMLNSCSTLMQTGEIPLETINKTNVVDVLKRLGNNEFQTISGEKVPNLLLSTIPRKRLRNEQNGLYKLTSEGYEQLDLGAFSSFTLQELTTRMERRFCEKGLINIKDTARGGREDEPFKIIIWACRSPVEQMKIEQLRQNFQTTHAGFGKLKTAIDDAQAAADA